MNYLSHDEVILAYKNGEINYTTAFGTLVGSFGIDGGTARDMLSNITPTLPSLPSTAPSLTGDAFRTDRSTNGWALPNNFFGFVMLMMGLK